MSSISATGINLSAIYQGVAEQTAAQTAQATTTVTPDQTSSSQPLEEGHGGHHHHHSGGMFGKIEQAVTSALQSAQADGSSSDPNQIIQDAITKVLQGPQSGRSSAGGTDPDGDGDPASAAQAAAGAQGFSQMLQAMGVDPQQFHSDFLAAVQAAQGGRADPSAAFQSFPPGATVNTTA